MVLIVGRDHTLAGCKEVDRETLAGLKFVSLHRSSTVQGIKASLEQHGIDWKTLRTVMVLLLSRMHFQLFLQPLSIFWLTRIAITER